jgi:hypothetical protein
MFQTNNPTAEWVPHNPERKWQILVHAENSYELRNPDLEVFCSTLAGLTCIIVDKSSITISLRPVVSSKEYVCSIDADGIASSDLLDAAITASCPRAHP